MKFIRQVLVGLLMLPAVSMAEIVVIVHPSVTFNVLSQDQVQRIFLNKTKKFPNGESAVPINQTTDSPLFDKFNEEICHKDPGQFRSYWSQRIFTGKGTPPKDGGDNADIIKLVSSNPNIIGYVESSAVVEGVVKVVFRAR